VSAEDNVVQRLKQQLAEARATGFKVRLEMLDGEQATWCEIAGVPTLFVDLSQTAAEQLQQVEETLAAYGNRQSTPETGHLHVVPPPQTDNDLEKRAA
jgi:hypothetical protein